MEWCLTKTIYGAEKLLIPQCLGGEVSLEVAVAAEVLRGVSTVTDPPDDVMGITGGHSRTGKDAGALAQGMMNGTMVVHRDGGEGAQVSCTIIVVG